jgi:ATP-dependent RNA helicase RhlB
MSKERDQHTPTFSDRRFDEFELHAKVQAGIKSAGFNQCTPIQAMTLPIALAGKDVAGQGQTGTGKTAAFLIATFNTLLHRGKPAGENDTNPRALILAPTRELAIQIHKDAVLLGSETGLKIGLSYGGIDYEKQRNQLRAGVDILIGTPGRIIDYFKQKVFHLNHLQVMVLDEADRMFDLGFIKDIRYLLRRMTPPDDRLSMLFSATLSLRVMELAYEHMNKAKRVEIEAESVTADRVEQVVYFPANNEKIPLLIGLLRSIDDHRTMVFCNMKRDVEKVAGYLNANGFEAAVLSGDVRQQKRQSLLKKFHDGEIHLLVATDVAARGLHIPDVSHVFNFDLPHDPEDYVHRIGRTARLGCKGDAVSFACEDYAFGLPDIEAYIEQRIPVNSVDTELLAQDLIKPPYKPRPPRGGRPSGGHGRRHGGGSGHHTKSGTGNKGPGSSRRRGRNKPNPGAKE